MKSQVLPNRVWYTLEDLAKRWQVSDGIVHDYVWGFPLLRFATAISKAKPCVDGFFLGEDSENLSNPVEFNFGDYLFLNVSYLRDSHGEPSEGTVEFKYAENFEGQLMEMHSYDSEDGRNNYVFEIDMAELRVPLVEVERFEQTFPVVEKPLNSHSTPLLVLLTKTIEEFWVKNSIQGPQKKDVVVAWLMQNFEVSHELSQNMAVAIDTICRPLSHKKKHPR